MRDQLMGVKRPDGQLSWIDVNASPVLKPTGELDGVVVTFADVSERLRVEDELRQSQKMEAVGTLASGVAHDFNNLLMGLIGCADIALDRLEAKHPARALIAQLRSGAMNGSQIAKQLMNFARPQQSDSVAVEVDSAIAGMEPMLRRLLCEDVELVVSLGAPHARIRCRPGELQQILMNVTINARQAMAQGGKVTIRTRPLHVVHEPTERQPGLAPGDYLELSMCDTGCGMDSTTRSRAFVPFFTTKDEGTGLGLSTVYAIVRQSEGHIVLRSERNTGTEVLIHLPFVRSSELDAPEVPRPAPWGSGKTVLVVEDEVLVRRAVEHYLSRSGFEVLAAARGSEALAGGLIRCRWIGELLPRTGAARHALRRRAAPQGR